MTQPASESLEPRRFFAAASAAMEFGQTDTTFGSSGHAYASVETQDFSSPTHLAVGDDGKIYAASDSCIARFTAAGKLDTTFATSGILTLPGVSVIGQNESVIGQAVDSSNRLVVVITLMPQHRTRTLLLRYTSAGQPDSTFGLDGSVIVTSDASFSPTAMTVQSDGKAIIVGTETTSDGVGREMRVFRANADGSADTSFGNGGSVQTYLGTAGTSTPNIYDEVNGVKLLASGDIEIGGGSVAFSSSGGENPFLSDDDYEVARLTGNGSLDSGFGSGGIVRGQFLSAADLSEYGISYIDQGLPLAFDARPDGSAVFVGNHRHNDDSISTVTSLNTDGSIAHSETLPADPIITLDADDVLALPDGRAVLASDSGYQRALAEYFPDGTVGPVVTNDDLDRTTDDADYGGKLALSTSGQLLVAGGSLSTGDLVVQQLNASTATAPRADDLPGGRSASIQIGAQGDINVAYYDSAARNLKFVRRLENGQWESPVTVDTHAGTGQYISLQTDSHGEPVIAYYDSRTRTLKAATSSDFGQTFKPVSVDTAGDVGQYAKGVGSVFAYYDATHGNLKLATLNSLGRWSTTTIDGSTDNVGTRIAVTVNPVSNHLMIAYYDATIGEVKYAGQTSKGFQIKNVLPAPGGVEGMTIFANGTYVPAIAYHDLNSDEVRLAVYTSDRPRFTAHTIATHTGNALGLIQSPASADPTMLIYSKYTNQLSVVSDPLEDRTTVETLLGGAELATYTVNEGALAALVDAHTGTLEVRDILSF